MSHFIEKCKVCDTVISQCRCPSPNKHVRYSVCKDCKDTPAPDNAIKKSEIYRKLVLKGERPSQDKAVGGDKFEVWLRTVCFQKPTPEAYDLAKDAWAESLKQASEEN